MGKVKQSSLADDMLDPKKMDSNFGRFMDHDRLVPALKKARHYKMTNEALRIVGDVVMDVSGVGTEPKALARQLAEMLDNSMPMHDKIFVRWESHEFALIGKTYDVLAYQMKASLEHLRRLRQRGPEFETGMLVERVGSTSWISISFMEHAHLYPNWLWWPAIFFLNTGEDPFPGREDVMSTCMGGLMLPAMTFPTKRQVKRLRAQRGKGIDKNGIFTGDLAEMDGQVLDPIAQIDMWGFQRDRNLLIGAGDEDRLMEDFALAKSTIGPLLNRGVVGMPARLLHSAVTHVASLEFLEKTLADLHGMVHVACRMLSAMNTPIAVENHVPSPGRRMLGNKGSVRLFDHHSLDLVIPKRIKKVREYLRSEIRKSVIGKRLHLVSPHYRHLTYKPQTPGWTEVVIDGETFWRKRIDEHMRGDASLGSVEHDEVRIKA